MFLRSVNTMAEHRTIFFIVCVLSFSLTHAWTDLKRRDSRGLGLDPGPLVLATQGEIWPKPQTQILFENQIAIEPRVFQFKVIGETCPVLVQALARYSSILQNMRKKMRKARRLQKASASSKMVMDNLVEATVNLVQPCDEFPTLQADEQYWLVVNGPQQPLTAQLKANTVWGILRGLETFVQLIYPSDNYSQLYINSVDIWDFPRFLHRGLHLDTARHFMPIKIINAILDGMAMNKMNVFHWHLVDDQSFPYVSKKFPDLSAKGAYSSRHTYSQADVLNIIQYARYRGIRVIPEFDTPGHTRSWGESYPELLTECYDSQGNLDGSLGPMNPIKNFTYDFMADLIQEISEVFSDNFLHLGGDEVPFDCWLSNPTILEYITSNTGTPEKLEQEYIQKIINIALSLKTTPIVWQEVFDNGVQLPNNVVVHVWKDWIDYKSEMANVTQAGYQALFSSCWYLDHLNTGGDWQKFYDCDPASFTGNEAAKQLVLGGEACMWAEVVDASNVLTRIWPRACAAAEKLWSSQYADNIDSAAKRLEEHACRMNLRGIPTQPPNGPGFCPFQLVD